MSKKGISNNRLFWITKRLFLFATILCVIAAVSACSILKPHFKSDFSIPEDDTASCINYLQNKAKSFLHMYNGTLYVFSGYSIYTLAEKGKLKLHYTMPPDIFKDETLMSFVFVRNKFYYCEGKENYLREGNVSRYLWVIDLEKKERMLVSHDFYSEAIPHSSYFVWPEPDLFTENGKPQFSHAVLDETGVHYFNYSDGKEKYTEVYHVGNSTVYVKYNWGGAPSIYVNKNGENEELFSRHDRYRVEQLPDGSLLIMNHLDYLGPRCIAWIYGTDGILHELMYVEGSDVHACANICDGYYYCSLWRYKESGYFTGKKYDNDELEGTWKINMSTFEKTKISHKVYEGLFVFGNQVIGIDSSNRLYYI